MLLVTTSFVNGVESRNYLTTHYESLSRSSNQALKTQLFLSCWDLTPKQQKNKYIYING